MNNVHFDLRKLDLNLLLVFNALFLQRSVTSAANELAMSPSALSHALTRLRLSLGDELFVRLGNKMQPTVRAEQISEPVSLALRQLSANLNLNERFNPSNSDRQFVFSASDYTAFAILPRLIASLQINAPGLKIKVVNSSQKLSIEDLAAGHIDFALGYDQERSTLPAGIEDFDWLKDEYVVIANKRHAFVQGELTLADYLRARHVIVTPWNESRGVIDFVLDDLGLQRQIALQLPTVLVAPFIVAESELLMTIPRHAAETLAHAAAINIFPAPFKIPAYTLKIYSHSKYARTDAHIWLRQELLSLAPGRRKVSTKRKI